MKVEIYLPTLAYNRKLLFAVLIRKSKGVCCKQQQVAFSVSCTTPPPLPQLASTSVYLTKKTGVCIKLNRRIRFVVSFSLINLEKRGDPSLKKFITDDTIPPLCLSATAQVVRLVPDSIVPEEDNQTRNKESEDEDPRQSRTQSLLGYLEVADVGRR